MTALIKRLDQAFKDALKGRQAGALTALRLLRTAIRLREVECKRQLSEAEIQAVINTQAKQRREAMTEYLKAHRPDLAQKEEEELDVLLSFLPPQLSPEELDAEITDILAQVGATSPKDLGKVMKAAMTRLSGRVDGKLVQEVVRGRLGA
jgi:uncharacterized protein YqeY